MGGHNTGCLVIYNQTDFVYTVVDQEDQSRRLTIPAHDKATFNGTVFPWCGEAKYIVSKAFRFYRDTDLPANGKFYMFQPYDDDRVHWSQFLFVNGVAEANYDSKQWAGAWKSKYVDVIIKADETPSVVTAME